MSRFRALARADVDKIVERPARVRYDESLFRLTWG